MLGEGSLTLSEFPRVSDSKNNVNGDTGETQFLGVTGDICLCTSDAPGLVSLPSGSVARMVELVSGLSPFTGFWLPRTFLSCKPSLLIKLLFSDVFSGLNDLSKEDINVN